MRLKKYRAAPWIKESLEALGSKEVIEWILMLHIVPAILFIVSLFVGDNHLIFFLMGYVWDVLMFVLLTLGFWMFDLDWDDE